MERLYPILGSQGQETDPDELLGQLESLPRQQAQELVHATLRARDTICSGMLGHHLAKQLAAGSMWAPATAWNACSAEPGPGCLWSGDAARLEPLVWFIDLCWMYSLFIFNRFWSHI